MVAAGIRTSVIEQGKGSSHVVLLHGNPDNATEWHRVLDLLGPGYHCIAFDLPGFGQAEAPPESYDFSIQAQTDFMDALLREIGLAREKLVLVAHDIGAVMAMGWAVVHPGNVKALIVSNAVFSSDYHWHTMARIWSTRGLGNLFMLSMTRFLFRQGMQLQFPNVPQEDADRMYAELTRDTRQTILRQYRKMAETDYFAGWEDRFQEISRSTPVSVVWGAADRLIPRKFAGRLGGDVRYLENVNHWPPLEAPEAIAEEIRRRAA